MRWSTRAGQNWNVGLELVGRVVAKCEISSFGVIINDMIAVLPKHFAHCHLPSGLDQWGLAGCAARRSTHYARPVGLAKLAHGHTGLTLGDVLVGAHPPNWPEMANALLTVELLRQLLVGHTQAP